MPDLTEQLSLLPSAPPAAVPPAPEQSGSEVEQDEQEGPDEAEVAEDA